MIGGRRILPGRMVAATLALAAIAACAATAEASGAIAPATQIAAARGVLSAPAEPAAAARAYWTASRMRAATPADLVLDAAGNLRRATPAEAPSARSAPAAHPRTAVDSSGGNTEYPGRVHGKVFFTIPGGSQPATSSARRRWSRPEATRWSGPPGTASSTRSSAAASPPTGRSCRAIATASGPTAPGRHSGCSPPRPGARTPTRAGPRRRARRARRRRARDRGRRRRARDRLQPPEARRGRRLRLPAEPSLFHLDFDGEHLFGCASPITGHDNPPGSGPPTLQIDCDMTGGSSGGGWVTADGCGRRASRATATRRSRAPLRPVPRHRGERALRTCLGGTAALCAGAEVTNLGSGGRDDFIGGARRTR